MTNIDQPRGNATIVDGRAVHNPGAFAPAVQSAPEAGSLLAPTADASTAQQYTGQDDAMIAFGTDVWLQDADGNEADLATLLKTLPVDESNMCDGCEGAPVVGARAPSNGPSEVERCDSCETFPGDFEAAQAVGARLGGGFTVWFEPDAERKSATPHDGAADARNWWCVMHQAWGTRSECDVLWPSHDRYEVPEQDVEHIEADRNHQVRPVPEDDGFSNCECGLACTSNGSRHGFDA